MKKITKANIYGNLIDLTERTMPDDVSIASFYGGTDNTNSAIKLYGKSHSEQAGDFEIIASDGITSKTLKGTVQGNLTWSGNFTANMVYNAVYNDYAEFFEKGQDVEAGDIVGLISDEVYGKATDKTPVIVGVCSNEYAMIIGGDENLEPKEQKDYIAVALSGRVHVKVDRKPELGDYIVPSNVAGIGTPSSFKTPKAVGQVVSVKDYDKTKMVRIKVI